MRWLDRITDSTDMSLSGLRKLVMDRSIGIVKSQTLLSGRTEVNWTESVPPPHNIHSHDHVCSHMYTHFLIFLNLEPWRGYWTLEITPQLLSSSCWIHRTVTTPAASFSPLLKNLCGHGGGEPGQDHPDWAQSHVLFPHQLVFIYLCHSTIITPSKCWWVLW